MAEKKDGLAKAFRTKAFRAGGYSAAAAAIVIVIALIINLLVGEISTAYTNIDTTATRLYSLSDETKTRLSQLEKDVTIYYVASDENRAGYITKILDKFKAAGNGLSVEYKDPDIDPDFASEFTDEAVVNGDLLAVCGDRARVIHSEDMIEYEAGSYEYYAYYLQNGTQTAVYWNGEVELLKAVDYVTSDEEYNVYFLTSPEADTTSLAQALDNENITCHTLESDDVPIPDNADCLVISGLTEDLSAEQAEAVGQYLEDGGKVYFAVSYPEGEMENIANILSDFGISFTSATLEDGDRNYSSEEVLVPEFTGEHAVISPFTSANYIIFPDAMGIVTEGVAGVTVTPLIKTSESAYLSTDPTDSLNFDEFTLGVAAESSQTGAQIIVYGTSSYTDSQYLENTSCSNVDLFINSVGYLCDKDSAIAVHAKAISSDTSLDFSHASQGLIITLMALVPAVGAIAPGFTIWYRRRNS